MPGLPQRRHSGHTHILIGGKRGFGNHPKKKRRRTGLRDRPALKAAVSAQNKQKGAWPEDGGVALQKGGVALFAKTILILIIIIFLH